MKTFCGEGASSDNGGLNTRYTLVDSTGYQWAIDKWFACIHNNYMLPLQYWKPFKELFQQLNSKLANMSCREVLQ